MSRPLKKWRDEAIPATMGIINAIISFESNSAHRSVGSFVMSESTVLPVADPTAELPPTEVEPGRLSLTLWVANLLAVILPFLGLGAAIFFLWGWGFSWAELGILLGMYLLTALGITVGFHRLFTHHSFETYRVVQFILAILGSMALQGSLLKWVALHRRHHAHSDRPGDPHSPHQYGHGILGLLRGLWHAPRRLDIPGRSAGPGPLCERPPPQHGPTSGERAIPGLGAGRLVDPGHFRRAANLILDGCLVWLGVGWSCSNLLSPPRHLERQLGLSFLGHATLPQRRS